MDLAGIHKGEDDEPEYQHSEELVQLVEDFFLSQNNPGGHTYYVLTPRYNCARIKLTTPRYGCNLSEMNVTLHPGGSHDQEQDNEQDTRLSRARQIDSRHRHHAGYRQKYSAQIPASP